MNYRNRLDNIVYTAENKQAYQTEKQPDHNTYTIISKVAYLIGVPECIFYGEYAPPKEEIFRELERDRNARIIRGLCTLRTAIEKNYRELNYQMAFNLRSFNTCTEYIPSETIAQLHEDGITIDKANCPLNHYIIEINRLISNRISSCRELFPIWLNWDYLRDIFIMPGGTTEAGIKKAAAAYYANINCYPYQVYINWKAPDSGNILYNDKKFLSLLYATHGDSFTDFSKVSDADAQTKDEIYGFLEEHERLVMIVDCENVDPYSFYAALQNLDQDALLDNVSRLILIDDVHTSSAWDILKNRIEIPTERIAVTRISERKSLVDQELIIRASREYYENNADAFIVVSSDSDYWPLVNGFTKADFFFMCEGTKLGAAMKERLTNENIPFCYLDDFCTDQSTALKSDAMMTAIRDKINSKLSTSIDELISDAMERTRAQMTPHEKRTFIERCMKSMRLVIAENGALSISVG